MVYTVDFEGDAQLKCRNISLDGVRIRAQEYTGLQAITDVNNETSNTIAISNVTQSTSQTTGAFTVSGGVGIAKDLYASKIVANTSSSDSNGSQLNVGNLQGSYLALGAHTEYSWMQSRNSKPLSLNAVGTNVGIGITNPSMALHVAGSIKGTGTDDGLLFLENTNSPAILRALTTGGQTFIQSGTASTSDSRADINFTSMFNGTTYMKIQGSTGNVGIGTANPETVLHVLSSDSSTSNQTLKLENPYVFGFNTGLDIGSSIVFKNRWQGDGINDPIDMVTIEGRKEQNANYGDSYISFKTRYETDRVNGGAGTLTEKMRITGNGNVGIGTASPGVNLDIYTTGYGDDTYALKIQTDNTNTATAGTLGPGIGFFQRWWSGGGVPICMGAIHCIKTEANGTSGGGLAFKTGNDTGATLATRMTINRAGNVGIGRTNPEASLHVQGARSIFGNNAGASDIVINDIPQARWQIGTGGYALRFSNHNSGSDEYSTWSEKVRIEQNGNVGIGTATPIAKFHVNGVDGRIWGLPVRSFDDTYALTYNATAYYADPAVSIWASGKIFAGDLIGSVGGTITASDERIKTNITDINDGDALATLRLLKPKKYQYKDTIKRGTEYVWGFIAQEVANTLSYSTQTTINTLPNIYEMANVSDSNVITFTNFDTSILESNASVIKVNARDGTDHLVKLVEVINDHTIRVEEDLSAWTGSVDETGNIITEITTTTLSPEEYETLEDKSGYVANITGYQNANVVVSIEEYNALEDTTGYEEIVQDYIKTTTTYPGTQLFIYGQEVDDFVFLKKDAIWTVATAALQEVDRQLQAEKEKVATLESQLTSVLARLDALESV
jgi:hypothetical protein